MVAMALLNPPTLYTVEPAYKRNLRDRNYFPLLAGSVSYRHELWIRRGCTSFSSRIGFRYIEVPFKTDFAIRS